MRNWHISNIRPFTEIAVIITINNCSFLRVPTKAGDLETSFVLLSTIRRQNKSAVVVAKNCHQLVSETGGSENKWHNSIYQGHPEIRAVKQVRCLLLPAGWQRLAFYKQLTVKDLSILESNFIILMFKLFLITIFKHGISANCWNKILHAHFQTPNDLLFVKSIALMH